MTSVYLLRIKAHHLETAENELLKATTNFYKSGGLCLKSVDKVLTAKKFETTCISSAKLFCKPSQQNPKSYH